jgi:hypothetical protein
MYGLIDGNIVHANDWNRPTQPFATFKYFGACLLRKLICKVPSPSPKARIDKFK